MGAGKSTVGSALAARLECSFEDLDQRIEQSAGRTVPEIFRESGEATFRRLERAALRMLLDELGSGVRKVVALGGGAFAKANNISQIEAAGVPTVFLDAPVDELWRRCRAEADDQETARPLMKSWASFRRLYEARRPQYLKATHREETGGKNIDQIVTNIILVLGLDRGK
jgi:shikimate kinase